MEATVAKAGMAAWKATAVMVEWPERIETLLPEDRLWIALTYVSETRRKLRISANGERSVELLEEFKKRAFGV